jgi:hypothetical protein
MDPTQPPIGPPPLTPPPPPPRKDKTLMIVLIVLGVLGAGALGICLVLALLLPAIAAAIKNSKIVQCENNLSQLTKAMYNYTIIHSPKEGEFPKGPEFQGGKFWLVLYETEEVYDPRLFDCTVAPTGRTPPRATAYQGPSSDPNAYASRDAIGADNRSLDSHGHSADASVAYNWVAKSGDVHKTPNDSANWQAIESKVDP